MSTCVCIYVYVCPSICLSMSANYIIRQCSWISQTIMVHDYSMSYMENDDRNESYPLTTDLPLTQSRCVWTQTHHERPYSHTLVTHDRKESRFQNTRVSRCKNARIELQKTAYLAL